jgi:hypothetical protein
MGYSKATNGVWTRRRQGDTITNLAIGISLLQTTEILFIVKRELQLPFAPPDIC